MKTVAIIQARLGSTRLPGKVLRDLQGRPMLAHVLRRVSQAATVDEVVVATSNARTDRRLWDWCRHAGWPCLLGSEDDVLDRYHQVAGETGADVIVRITADCPLADAALIDRAVARMIAEPEVDLVSSVWPNRTFPRGLDVEVVRRGALERLHRQFTAPDLREHVTLAAYRHPTDFRIEGIRHGQDRSGWRLTVDTIEDLQVVRLICRQFAARSGDDWGPRSWAELEPELAAHPSWLDGNRHIQQKVA